MTPIMFCSVIRASHLKIPDGPKMARAALSRRAIDGSCAVMIGLHGTVGVQTVSEFQSKNNLFIVLRPGICNTPLIAIRLILCLFQNICRCHSPPLSVSISLALSVCLCLSLCLSLCFSVFVSLCLSLSVSICLCMSLCLSLSLSVCL